MSQSLPTTPSLDLTRQIAPLRKEPELTALFWEDEGCICFLVKVKGFYIARRDDNHMINATKLLNVTSLTRGRRNEILKKEQVKHVVRVGPMHLIGVWIPFERALKVANNKALTEILYPLFVHNIRALVYHPNSQTVQDSDTPSIGSTPSIRVCFTRRLSESSKTATQTPESTQMVALEQLLVNSNTVSKIHQRSRSGCYMCRLRRMKCAGSHQCCTACEKLGLQCEYKQPLWWNDITGRRMQREHIKSIIKPIKVLENPTPASRENHYIPGRWVDYLGNDFSRQSIYNQVDMYENVPTLSYDANPCYHSSFSTYPFSIDMIPSTQEQGREMDFQLVLDPQLPL